MDSPSKPKTRTNPTLNALRLKHLMALGSLRSISHRLHHHLSRSLASPHSLFHHLRRRRLLLQVPLSASTITEASPEKMAAAQRNLKSTRRMGPASKSSVYADVNLVRPKEYWDYEPLAIHGGDQDEYKVERKVGRGKYSEAFQGVHSINDEKCIIKILKPVKKKKVLGTDELSSYLSKYLLMLDPRLEALVGRHSRKPGIKFINGENQHIAVPEAIDFMDKLLRYDHQERLTAKEAMAHPYFHPVRTAESSRTCTQ